MLLCYIFSFFTQTIPNKLVPETIYWGSIRAQALLGIYDEFLLFLCLDAASCRVSKYKPKVPPVFARSKVTKQTLLDSSLGSE